MDECMGIYLVDREESIAYIYGRVSSMWLFFHPKQGTHHYRIFMVSTCAINQISFHSFSGRSIIIDIIHDSFQAIKWFVHFIQYSDRHIIIMRALFVYTINHHPSSCSLVGRCYNAHTVYLPRPFIHSNFLNHSEGLHGPPPTNQPTIPDARRHEKMHPPIHIHR